MEKTRINDTPELDPGSEVFDCQSERVIRQRFTPSVTRVFLEEDETEVLYRNFKERHEED